MGYELRIMDKEKKKGKKQDKAKNRNIVSGIIKITQKPLGFLDLPDGDSVIIFEENLNCALEKDEVEVEILGRDRNRKKGKVVKIIKRNKTKFVGTFENKKFIPDDFKFYREVELREFPKNLNSGTKVLVEINWTNPNLNPRGKILEIIGKKGEHETEMQSILLDKGIVYDFPEGVEKEAKEIFESRIKNYELSSRRDFRDILTFTIDPKDAKDFDDALSYRETSENKIEVGVHIADVSFFVQPNTALDREARKRAFSTYLVDRTVPMLPKVLSNNLCSLVPNEDRLAFSAVFDIEKSTGQILNRWFGRTIINSKKRFTYEEAQKILELKNMNYELWEKNFGKELEELNRIAKIYREENKKNGAIEFETDEVKFELDEKGKPIKVYKKARLDTMKMIEDWMLLANREVAKFINDKANKRGGIGLFRIHDLPNVEKLEELSIFVKALGHNLPIGRGGYVSAKDLNILLSEIEGHSAESLIKTAAIRSMAKAEYSTQNIGHYGLAFEYYTHFTSPIRRYPDLLVHRILDSYLSGQTISKKEFSNFSKIAEEASEKEISIAEAERESIKYKQVEFMQNQIGKEFDCIISGVTEFGMFVQDPETKAEGLIKIRDIEDDFYSLDSKNYCLIGQNSRKKYSLGDSVRARLVSASLDRKTLDFKLL